jgi:hypothetical protein
MSPRRRSGQVSSVVATAVLLTLGGEAVGADPRPLAVNKPLNAFDSAAVERARSGAARRLRNPECLKVLTDFTDGEGKTLEQNLGTWGLSAADYLKGLAFRDGSAMAHCRKATIEMVTSVGFPRVYVCPAGVGVLNSRFARVQIENPTLAESMVIHEMLHTLGLGENPPSSFEITELVTERCR